MGTKNNKGQAGLSILLSVVVTLFIIGLMVTIFSLMSSEIQDQDMLYERTASATVTGETVPASTRQTATGDQLLYGTLRSAQCSIVAVYNGTVTGTLLNTNNYTEVSECYIRNSTGDYGYSNWAVNYTYTYLADSHGTAGVVNDTVESLSSTTDWFDIFIVITAMVVLILLTVIIITSIRNSGMVGGAGSQNGAKSIGTA